MRLKLAGGILIALGVGHLVLAVVLSAGSIAGWADRGLWAAVPLLPGGDQATVASVRNTAVFWAGPGSFAVPLTLLGLLIRHLAGRGAAVPVWLGWALAAWCLIGGVLLVPSPYFAGVIAGALIISAHRTQRRETT